MKTITSTTSNDDVAIENLLRAIDANTGGATNDQAPVEPTVHEVEAAVAEAEQTEALQGAYANAGSTEIIEDETGPTLPTVPTQTPAEIKAAKKVVADAAKAAKKAAAVTAAAEKKAAKEAAAAKKAESTTTPAAPAKPKRQHFAHKTDAIKHYLNGELATVTILTKADAALSDAERAVKTDETLAAIAAAGQKVQNRASIMLTYIAGKGKLSKAIEVAFRTLVKDSQIKSGDEGNLHKALVAVHYDPKSARAMGGNTIRMFTILKIVTAGDKGVFTPNDDSVILEKVRGLLKI